MSEVDELRARGRGPGGLLDVVESRQEYRKVVVVDRDGGARFGDLDSPYSLLARHRDNGDQEGRATRVDQAEVNVGVAARDVLQVIDEHGVPGDVEPVELIAVAAEVEQVPVDRHEQRVDCVVCGVLSGHRGDLQRRVAHVHAERVPGGDEMGPRGAGGG